MTWDHSWSFQKTKFQEKRVYTFKTQIFLSVIQSYKQPVYAVKHTPSSKDNPWLHCLICLSVLLSFPPFLPLFLLSLLAKPKQDLSLMELLRVRWTVSSDKLSPLSFSLSVPGKRVTDRDFSLLWCSLNLNVSPLLTSWKGSFQAFLSACLDSIALSFIPIFSQDSWLTFLLQTLINTLGLLDTWYLASIMSHPYYTLLFEVLGIPLKCWGTMTLA